MDIASKFQNFKNEWITKRVADPTLAYELPASQWYQCVSLIKQYLREEFGINPGYWGDAIDWWTHTNAGMLGGFDRLGGSAAEVGDIVVLNPDHIGIATGNINDANVEILEQNGQTGGGTGTGGDAIRTRYVARSRVAGILRPKGAVVSAPAPAPAPHNESHVGQTLVLPASVSSWRVYRIAGPWVVGTEVAKLNPAEFGGLTYKIEGNPAANIYIITTQMFGQVAIYAGPDTPASFTDDAPAPPAPPAPAEVVVPVVPAPQPKPANITYTKLETPLNLVTNKQPTDVWDLGFADDAHATALQQLSNGASFVAYGRAQRTDGDKPAYFMTADDFGNADTTGQPVKNKGVNTVDLSPAPTPASAPAEDPGEKVEVKVNTNNPDVWQQTFVRNLGPVNFVANTDATIHDLTGVLPDQQLVKGQKVVVTGCFTQGGKKYYRTAHSIANGAWYGLPEDVLTKEQDLKDDALLEETLNSVAKIRHDAGIFTSREKNIARVASVEGFFSHLIHRKKNK